MLPNDAAAQGASGGGGCRLNGLPDHVLVRVLSHRKAWEAVRTSLLSKRWRGLWASVTRLDIRQQCGCSDVDSKQCRRAEEFARFVTHLLFRRRGMLDALRVCWSHPGRDGDSATWIAHAIRCGAKEIELSPPLRTGYCTPDYLSFIPGDMSQPYGRTCISKPNSQESARN